MVIIKTKVLYILLFTSLLVLAYEYISGITMDHEYTIYFQTDSNTTKPKDLYKDTVLLKFLTLDKGIYEFIEPNSKAIYKLSVDMETFNTNNPNDILMLYERLNKDELFDVMQSNTFIKLEYAYSATDEYEEFKSISLQTSISLYEYIKL